MKFYLLVPDFWLLQLLRHLQLQSFFLDLTELIFSFSNDFCFQLESSVLGEDVHFDFQKFIF